MMDFHLLIVITCVFLASLCSLLFINKFFRRKTFEEIIAEKKAMTDKIYGQNKVAAKKPKKLQQLKKEQKREKKQRQREQQRDNNEEPEDSDAPSEQASVEDDDQQPLGLSKTHVEFEPDPEVMTYNNIETIRRASMVDTENVGGVNPKQKSKKEKKNPGKSGILLNKNEPIAIVKENLVMKEPLNHFEAKQPKDDVEMKKQERERKEEKLTQQQQPMQGKKEKTNKKEKQVVEQPAAEVVNVAKELKQLDEKLVRLGSPKNQHNQNNNNNNSNKLKQQTKKQNKETAATKELVVALDKLSETDTIGVSLLMNLFRRAELNRSEIQILIDYLLNKQQDMPSTHSEWSDDICQKLKRQLEEKERALVEEQEASIGIQAKLRDLRTEVNTERAQMNATIKAYMEKIHAKEQELTALNQEMQSVNDKIAIERQQFQAKLLREKQAGSQDLLTQLQMMQNELAHKDKCITELTCMVNASRQAVEESQQKSTEIIQSQVQQIRALEQQRDELEQISNTRVFELEQAKTMECENAENKVEIRNLQNALESSKVDLMQSRKELDDVKSELVLARDIAVTEKQTEIQALHVKNNELTQQIAGIKSKSQEQSKEQSGLQASVDALKAQVAEKEQQVSQYDLDNSELAKKLNESQLEQQQQEQQQDELKKNIDILKTEVVAKNKRLLEVEQTSDKFSVKEKELLQQLQEQKEKNNELRMKNWKLVEALQIAETTVKQNKQLSSGSVVQQHQLLASQKSSTNTITTNVTTATDPKDQKHMRELFQRLYPDAVKANATTALSLSFDQWIEQVLATHIKQSSIVAATTEATISSSNKSTQSNNSSNHNNNSLNNTQHNNTNLSNNESPTTASNNLGIVEQESGDATEMQKLRTQNSQLRVNIDELTNLVKKTSNTLSELEIHAREQDEHWRNIVRSKEEQIYSLQHSNGEQLQDI